MTKVIAIGTGIGYRGETQHFELCGISRTEDSYCHYLPKAVREKNGRPVDRSFDAIIDAKRTVIVGLPGPRLIISLDTGRRLGRRVGSSIDLSLKECFGT